MLLGGKIIHIIFIGLCMPEMGRPNEEKESFGETLDDQLGNFKGGSDWIIALDLNGQDVTGNEGFDKVMGKDGYVHVSRNIIVMERKHLDLSQAIDSCMNTLYNKQEEEKITCN